MAENENIERNTHFAGFASLLMDEMDNVLHILDNPYFVSPGMRHEVERLIAKRAYDLAGPDTPDLTEWPNTSPEAP